MSLDEEIIICAVRYALGRRTYIVQDVIQYILKNKDSISGYCKNIIIRDVTEHLSTYKRLKLGYCYGEFEKAWIVLVKRLRGESNEV